MSDAIRVADRIAATLHAAGVRHAFGMPGGEVITLVDALEGAGIRFVLARNETAAAMMAAGTCVEATRPGLLVTTLGPGLANGINGIADAMQERTPLIVLSGVVERKLRGRYTHQIVDHHALLAPLVKASFEAEAENASEVVARAIRLAMTHPCGPVHVDLAPDVAALPSKESRAARPVMARPAAADRNDPIFTDLRERLRKAQRPLIIAGLDAARDPAHAAFPQICDRLQIPVVTTYKGKGLIDEAHPASLGAAGLSPLADRVLLDVVRQSDLLLLVGYDPIEMRPGWLDPVDDPDRIIELGHGFDHGMHTAGTRLAGAPVGLLEALCAGLEAWPVWAGDTIALARRKLADLFSGPGTWGPHAVVQALQKHLKADAAVSVDSGAHRILLSQAWCANKPLRLLQSAGWCTMGSAIPLAIGHRLSRPEMPAIAVLGDGGLEMTMGELGTLRDQGVAILGQGPAGFATRIRRDLAVYAEVVRVAQLRPE